MISLEIKPNTFHNIGRFSFGVMFLISLYQAFRAFNQDFLIVLSSLAFAVFYGALSAFFNYLYQQGKSMDEQLEGDLRSLDEVLGESEELWSKEK